MEKRRCLGCGGELVMAFRPSENSRSNTGDGPPMKPIAKWRCSTCGQTFSAEELRADRRGAAKVAAQA